MIKRLWDTFAVLVAWCLVALGAVWLLALGIPLVFGLVVIAILIVALAGEGEDW